MQRLFEYRYKHRHAERPLKLKPRPRLLKLKQNALYKSRFRHNIIIALHWLHQIHISYV